jgi:hypothetical protein
MLSVVVFMTDISSWVGVVPVALWVFWFVRLLDEAMRMFVAEMLFGLFHGPGLRPFWMDLRAEALF